MNHVEKLKKCRNINIFFIVCSVLYLSQVFIVKLSIESIIILSFVIVISSMCVYSTRVLIKEHRKAAECIWYDESMNEQVDLFQISLRKTLSFKSIFDLTRSLSPIPEEV